jgi:hypothetical protein
VAAAAAAVVASIPTSRRGSAAARALAPRAIAGISAATRVRWSDNKRSGVTIPVSETGETMPWHSLRHSFGTECAVRGVPLPKTAG